MSSLGHLTLLEEFLANGAQCTRRPLFFFLLFIFPFGSGIRLSGKAEMSSLNCVYLLALWCESAPRQLHINLVSVCIYFPLPLSPGLIYGLPFPASCCHSDKGSPMMGTQASGRSKTCPFKMSCRVVRNPAICVAGLKLDQAFPHLLMS